MKILVNALPLSGITTGISRYVRNLYTHLLQLPDLEVCFFNGRRIHQHLPQPPEQQRQIRHTDSRRKLPDAALFAARSLRWLFYEEVLNRRLKKRFDLYHETAFTPARLRNGPPQVFTLHDLSLQHYPMYHPRERVWFSSFFFNRRINEASHIIVPSNFIKNEVCRQLQLPSRQVTVVPEAPAPVFHPRDRESVRTVLRHREIPEPYLLFAGTLEPRKNLDIIIEALHSCAFPVHLVLVGWQGWGEKTWMQKIQAYGLAERVHITGYINDEDLACLYTGAAALVYPSFYEGFGLPLLEAMACGCPVLASNAASLPEVGGDAALYFHPERADQLLEGINCLLSERPFSAEMAQRGIRRASAFTWRASAERTREVFLRVSRDG